MWALRRVSLPRRKQGFSIGTSQACCANLEIPLAFIQEKPCFLESPQSVSGEYLPSKRFYYTTDILSKLSVDIRSLSSHAGTKSSGEDDDLEDGFSELETPPTAEAIQVSNTDNESEDALVSGPEVSDDEEDIGPSQNELELSESESDPHGKRSPRRRLDSALFKAIMEFPGLSVHSALDKWVGEGNDLSRADISLAMIHLRRRKMFGRALQVSEWLEAHKQIEFTEKDYASRLDLIGKVRGLWKAEKYVEMIPQSFRGELIYRTLLANCVAANNLKKAEDIFNKMKDLEFPISPFTCNQLLLIYKKHDKKKIADVLLLMEKENVKPTAFTYKLLISAKGEANDIAGMEQVYKTMKAEGIEPEYTVKAIMARHYAFGGLKEKAEAMLKEIEGGDLKENLWACRALLPLYAELGQVDEVRRVWNACASNPRVEECMAAIEAWGKLNNIEEAEAIFDRMVKTWNRLSSKQYAVLLKVYTNHNMIAKGKDLVKRMADNNCEIGPLTWDALVKLYVGTGEVEKADSILAKAAEKSQKKPLFTSYMAIMEQYSKRGDVHNSEKILYRMRQVGYIARLRQFQCLVQAYINANAPAYGLWERMKSDNIFPNKALIGQLTRADPFKKTAASDLLD
ncbi:pentatricopeptide repeat-containing protein At1g80270, mitochondrial-like [Argentina anserina]|uniref:pentatricopeptide repeat-containing protein At1g80270, mitochondrial-like n=1 Tax=Argentina anserina TaxID=57926 RepID=UPI00217628C0|nr:pentatricopeptide repeat-containing protein At1g80270, mitochondrial-like [Potentilla anserina]